MTIKSNVSILDARPEDINALGFPPDPADPQGLIDLDENEIDDSEILNDVIADFLDMSRLRRTLDEIGRC